MKIFISLYLLIITSGFAATKNNFHLPINHCYHWISESSNNYLSFKYDYASKNNNELTFFTTPSSSNGSVAGPGLYCAKSPSGSYSYGDRLIRVELVDDIVLYDEDNGINHCGTSGENSNNSTDCANKTWDIKFYSGGGAGNSAWYVIQNPASIKSWSANSNQLINDLKKSMTLNDSSFKSHATSAIQFMQYERTQIGEKIHHTQTTRASIVEIIVNNPEKLNSIPALSIISRLSIDKSDLLTIEERKDIYKRYLHIALKSYDIDYKSYERILKNDKSLSEEFLSILKKEIPNLQNDNPYLVLEALLDSNLALNLDKNILLENLIPQIFKVEKQLAQFSSSSYAKNKLLKSSVTKELYKLIDQDNLTKNLIYISPLLDNILSSRQAKKQRAKIIKNITYVTNSSINIKIGRSRINFDPQNMDIQNSCNTIIKFAKYSGDVELTYYKTKIKLGQIKGSTNIDQICSNADQLVKSLSTIKNSKIKEIKYIVPVRAQAETYIFAGESIEDITDQCLLTSYTGSSIDKIYWSVNGSSEVKVYNSKSYWNTIGEICRALTGSISGVIPTKTEVEAEFKYNTLIAKWNAGKNSSHIGYKLIGRFQKYKFFFFGNNRDEIIKQCRTYFDEVGNIGSIDRIYWSLNDSDEEEIYNAASYWTTKNAVCGQVLKAIDGQVPSLAEINAEKKYNSLIAEWKTKQENSGSIYKLVGRFMQFKFFFFGENRDELEKQCEAYYDHITEKNNIDAIFWSLNNSKEAKLYNSSSYWKTKQAVCSKLIAAIAPAVPTKADVDSETRYKSLITNWENKQNTSSTKYKVSGRFEDFKYFFFGEDRDAILAQCQKYYSNIVNKDSIDDIYVSVNEGKEENSHNSDSYWKTKNAVCNQLEQVIATRIPSTAELQTKATLLEWKESFSLSNATYKVTGKFETFPYYFFANSRDEIISQCHEFYSLVSNKDSIDDITIILNNRATVKRHNEATYWKSKNTVCGVLESELDQHNSLEFESKRIIEIKNNFIVNQRIFENSYIKSRASYKIDGIIGDIPFFFTGEDQDRILEKCMEYINLSPDQNIITDMSLNLNGNEISLNKNVNSANLCLELKKVTNSLIPTKYVVEKEIFNIEHKNNFDSSLAKYKGELKMNDEVVYFQVDNIDQVEVQCLESAYYFESIASTYSFEYLSMVNRNDSIKTNIKLKGNTRNELCLKVKNEFYQLILSPEIEDMKEIQVSSRAKYKVSGMFGLTPYYFYGESASELKTQCNDNYSLLKDINGVNKVTNFTWKVEGKEKVYKVTRFSTLRSRRSLCKIFGKNLKKQLRK
jgi:hypothetical protein